MFRKIIGSTLRKHKDSFISHSSIYYLLIKSILGELSSKSSKHILADQVARLSATEHVFTKLNSDEKRSWSTNIYKNILRSQSTLCKKFKKYCTVFIQPVALIDKDLTPEEELRLTGIAQLKYQDKWVQSYKKLESDLLKEKSEGVSIHSLVSLFKDKPFDIYGDIVHFRIAFPDAEMPTAGNTIMIEAIADSLEKDWGLVRK